MMMLPGNYPLVILQGATFEWLFTLTDEAGTAFDLSGVIVRMQIRSTIESATVILELNTANGRALVTNAAAGEITLSISAVDTAALNFEDAVYDMEMLYLDGSVHRPLSGVVTLNREVTR